MVQRNNPQPSVFLQNETNQSIPISVREGRWWDFISAKLYRNTIAIPKSRVGIISVAKEIREHRTGNVSKDLSVLSPGELIKTTARIKLDNSFQLPEGKYKLELRLNPIRFGSKFPYPNRILPAILSIEVREVKSRADFLDYYLHQAIRSRWNKEYSKASEFLSKVTAMNPNSIPAKVELGMALCEQGKTQEGIRLFEAAIKSVETKSDPEHYVIMYRVNPDHPISNIRDKINTCKGRAR